MVPPEAGRRFPIAVRLLQAGQEARMPECQDARVRDAGCVMQDAWCQDAWCQDAMCLRLLGLETASEICVWSWTVRSAEAS